jgi:putative zinc finger/helix-turn-helix YgiT family protein
MKTVSSSVKLCLSCMEKHRVDVVQIEEHGLFKNEDVGFIAAYEYCSTTNELLETEDMMRANSLAIKDAYRGKVGLLKSEDIIGIRKKYGISQKDFADILDWGKATITRYENHQVQDRAHDDILRKINSDPKWLLEMLKRAKGRLSQKTYAKYHHNIAKEYRQQGDHYLRDAIYASYANYEDDTMTGCMELNLDKVIEAINYLAKKVNNLHKVKLMKMLWYSDTYNHKRYGHSITGLAYRVLKMGAVPEGYEQIVLLEGISYEVAIYDDIAYKFKPVPGFKIKNLSDSDIESIDKIISMLGDLSTSEIVGLMHKEKAYKKTPSNQIIPYTFSKDLKIL